MIIFVLLLFAIADGVPRRSDNTRNLADVPCGRQTRRGSRIVGGGDAVPGEFPWMASIKKSGGHFCGGAIINKRWVVTAGHCMCTGTELLRAEDLTVGVGEHDLGDAVQTQDIKVSNIYFYPEYKCPKFVDDIALLKLKMDIFWSDSVAPICLPGNRVPSYSDREATAAGWGWLNEDHSLGGRSDILQKVKLTVVDNAKCRDWYSSQGKKTKILDSQLCAGYENGGKDTCWIGRVLQEADSMTFHRLGADGAFPESGSGFGRGDSGLLVPLEPAVRRVPRGYPYGLSSRADSGGPLMVLESEGMAVVGVVSSGIGCGRPRLPGVYTRMTEYLPWLLRMIEGE